MSTTNSTMTAASNAGTATNRRHNAYFRYLSNWRSSADRRLSRATTSGNIALYRTIEQECQLIALLQSGIIPAILDHLPEYQEIAKHQYGKLILAAKLHADIRANLNQTAINPPTSNGNTSFCGHNYGIINQININL